MRRNAVNGWLLVLLLLETSLWWASPSVRAAAATDVGAPVPSNDPGTVEAVKKVERDMGSAMVSADIAELDRIFADDWATVGTAGNVITKEQVLHEFRSGKERLVSFKNGPIDVQVFGNVAVAHAGVVEQKVRDGQDDSGESVWMDLLEKRSGKWVVVRSAAAGVK